MSRSHYDNAERILTALIDAAEQRTADLHTHYGSMLQREQARFDALAERYHALRLTGAAVPEPTPIAPPAKEADPLVQEINVLSAGRPGLRSHMMRQLAYDRRNALLDDGDILARIQSGVPAYEDGVPV